MQKLVLLILIGLFMYFIFRKGKIGCCGGHSMLGSERHKDVHPKKSYPDDPGRIIDLRENEYVVVDYEEKKISRDNRNN